MNTQSDQISQSIESVKYLLQNFPLYIAKEGNLFAILFGENYNETILDSILNPWNNCDFSNLPKIQILSSNILGNANGGYSLQTNTIYLADTFLNNAQPYTIEVVILEEIGHWIDAQINTVAPVWDAVFAEFALTQREREQDTPLSLSRVGGVRVREDDSATILIDG